MKIFSIGKSESEGLIFAVALGILPVALTVCPCILYPGVAPLLMYLCTSFRKQTFKMFLNFLEKVLTHKKIRLSNFLSNCTIPIVLNQSNCESICSIFLVFVILMAKLFLNFHKQFKTSKHLYVFCSAAFILLLHCFRIHFG